MMKNILSTLSTAVSTASLLGLLRPRSSIAGAVVSHAASFLAGVTIGAAAGLLLAPKSGRELRADLRAGVRDVSGELRATATALRDAGKRVVTTSEPQPSHTDASGNRDGNSAETAAAAH